MPSVDRWGRFGSGVQQPHLITILLCEQRHLTMNITTTPKKISRKLSIALLVFRYIIIRIHIHINSTAPDITSSHQYQYRQHRLTAVIMDLSHTLKVETRSVDSVLFTGLMIVDILPSFSCFHQSRHIMFSNTTHGDSGDHNSRCLS